MLEKLEEIKRNLLDEISSLNVQKEAEQLRTKYLGRKGIVSDLMKLIPTLPIDKRVDFGRGFNSLKTEITNII